MLDPGVRQLDEQLRILICPHCGYSLEGLPHEGTCPECGQQYDQSAILLHGYASGKLADFATASPKQALWLLLGQSSVFAFVAWQNWYSQLIYFWGVPFGFCLTSVVLRLIGRANASGAGLVTVEFRPDGCRQMVRRLGSGTLEMLGDVVNVLTLPVSAGWITGAVLQRFPWGPSLGLGVGVAILIFRWLTKARDAGGATWPEKWQTMTACFRRNEKPARAEWARVNRVRFEPTKEKLRRLRITADLPDDKPDVDVVDALIPLDDGDSRRLAQQIYQWAGRPLCGLDQLTTQINDLNR